jgi:hypothetical protein
VDAALGVLKKQKWQCVCGDKKGKKKGPKVLHFPASAMKKA